MDVEQLIKIVGVLITAFIGPAGLWLSTRQYFLGTQAAYREEYKFAKMFFEDLEKNPKMHAFARQKGYQAIAGSQNLPASVIKHLMSLFDPVLALQDYILSKSYLSHTPGPSKRQLSFSAGLISTHKRRQFCSVSYFVGFVIFYIAGFSPFYLWVFGEISPRLATVLSVLTLPIGLFLAIVFGREFRQLRGAMRLVKNQNDEADRDEPADDERD